MPVLSLYRICQGFKQDVMYLYVLLVCQMSENSMFFVIKRKRTPDLS